MNNSINNDIMDTTSNNSLQPSYNELYEMGTKKLIENNNYFIYVPENMENKPAEVVIYYPGADGYEKDDIAFREFVGSNPDKIVIINKNPTGAIDSELLTLDTELLNELESIQNNSGIANIDIYGHSLGESYAFDAAVFLNSNGYHTDNIIITGSASNTEGFKISDEDAINLAENGTKVLVFNEYERSQAITDYLIKLIDNHVPIGFVYGAGFDYDKGFGDRHAIINIEPIRKGLIYCLNGHTGKLDKNDQILTYYYSIYDYEQNKWIDNISEEEFWKLYSISKIMTTLTHKEIDAKYNFLKLLEDFIPHIPTITSDTAYLINELNKIRSQIKTTSFIGSLSSSLGNINSNNPILSLENDYMINYFNDTGKLLEKLVKETNSMINYDLSIQKIENTLIENAESLDEHI